VAEAGVERRLTTILAADVVGYSRLMAADESGTLAQLKTHRKEIIEPKTAEYRGRVVKLMGDGTLMEFASVVDAVHFAVDVQQAMAERNAKVPEDRRITYRIGINIGDIIVEGDDIYGDGVNIAARLEGLTDPGGICVARNVYNQVKAKVDVGFEDLGAQQVKNIPEPVQMFKVVLEPSVAGRVVFPTLAPKRPWRWPVMVGVLAVFVVAAGAVLWQRPWEPREELASVKDMAFPLPDKPSIAVLPFTNMSDDPGQGYFADGMTDDLITDLSKVGGLFVIARNSTFVYKGQAVEIHKVAEDLGVRYVVEGSVRRAGDTVRVNAQLIDATTGGHVWAERFDGEVADIFRVQDEFVRKIVEALAINLSASEQNEIGQGQTDQIEAREAFQRGWDFYLRFTAEDNAAAVSHLERAIELDPEYGRAYAALSLVYFRGSHLGWQIAMGTDGRGARQLSLQYMEQARQFPTALVHVAEALDHLRYGRAEEALIKAARAIALDPNDPEAHIVMAWAMTVSGKPEEGLNFVNTAMRLDPRYPSHYVLARGIALFAMGDLNQAARVFEEGLERDPGALDLAPLQASILAQLGNRKQAREAVLRWRPGRSQLVLQSLPNSYNFPFRWAGEHRKVRERLLDGFHIAVLPLEVTVPSLVQTLQGDNPFARLSAVKTLGRFGPMAEPAVPALIVALDDELEGVRKGAVFTLGKIGPAAKDAIPALEAMREEILIGPFRIEALEKIRDK